MSIDPTLPSRCSPGSPACREGTPSCGPGREWAVEGPGGLMWGGQGCTYVRGALAEGKASAKMPRQWRWQAGKVGGHSFIAFIEHLPREPPGKRLPLLDLGPFPTTTQQHLIEHEASLLSQQSLQACLVPPVVSLTSESAMIPADPCLEKEWLHPPLPLPLILTRPTQLPP